MSVYKDIGEKIKKVRKENKFSQEELAEKAKIDPKSIIEIENGNRNPSIKTLNKIAVALKIQLKDLL